MRTVHTDNTIDLTDKNANGLVSVLIPVYNTEAELLRESVYSSLDQDYKHKEIVIVNDGSTSTDTLRMLDKLSNKKNITVVDMPENKGISVALNIGMKYCKSDIVARMDADDVMIKGRLTNQYKFLKDKQDYTCVGGQIEVEYRDKKEDVTFPLIVTQEYFKKKIWVIHHPATMFRKSVVIKEGGYTLKNGMTEDLDMLYRLVARGYKIGNIPQKVLRYRKGLNGQLTRSFFDYTNLTMNRITRFYDNTPDKMFTQIPKYIHFIFGLDKDFGGKPFSLVHYLAIKSAHDCNPDYDIFFYYEYEPNGYWWEQAKKLVKLMNIKAPTEIYGNKLYHVAHKADVLRLQILRYKGGIYLDIDTICKKSFDDLLQNYFVIGKEYVSEEYNGLCNAVILSMPNHPFIIRWIQSYKTFRSKGWDEYWSEHSVVLPKELIKSYSNHTLILDEKKFHYPLWTDDGLRDLFIRNIEVEGNYVHHLWETKSWEYLKSLSIQHILSVDTTYNLIARKYISNEDTFTEIFNTNFWNGMESKSGVGSDSGNASTIVQTIENLLYRFNVESITDVGCGDWNWMRLVNNKGVKYIGIDVVADNILNNTYKYANDSISFVRADVTDYKYDIPRAELIICRDLLQHLNNSDCLDLLEKIKKSCNILLVTTYVNGVNSNIKNGQYRSLDLSKEPFNLKFTKIIPEDIFNDTHGRSLGIVIL